MTRCLLTIGSFGLAQLLAAAPARGQTVPENPVNDLLITADDLGFQMGVYGDSAARTPHLDRLAEEGLRLTRAYVTQSSCSPSRSSILRTGDPLLGASSNSLINPTH